MSVIQPGRQQGCRQLSRGVVGQGLGVRDSRTAGPHSMTGTETLVAPLLQITVSLNNVFDSSPYLTVLTPQCQLICEGQRQLDCWD